MTATVTDVSYGTTLVALACGECGMPFGLPERFRTSRQQDGRNFYCPNGHSISWHETELDRVKRDLERKSAALADWRAEAASESRRARAYKGQVTKLKKRVAAGVCPVCTRTFQSLQRHMHTQHPNFIEDQNP